MRQAAEEAARDRLRFFMRLDHELKNPLTAIRAGLANIEQGGGMALASAGTVAALASVSVQADRIARLVSDLRKLADLETQGDRDGTGRPDRPAATRWPRPSPRSPRPASGSSG